MTAATLQARIAAPIERVWGVIADFARYPEFVPGVKGCRVVREGPEEVHVEYDVDLGVRRVHYVLAIHEERPRRLWWTLVRGDLLTRSDGAWELREEEGGTLASYTADIQVQRPPLVPRFVVERVVDELTRVQMPAILGAFKARAEGAA